MNAPGVPKVRMKVDEFLAWADAQAEHRGDRPMRIRGEGRRSPSAVTLPLVLLG